jgi:hypothetical protein
MQAANLITYLYMLAGRMRHIIVKVIIIAKVIFIAKVINSHSTFGAGSTFSRSDSLMPLATPSFIGTK